MIGKRGKKINFCSKVWLNQIKSVTSRHFLKREIEEKKNRLNYNLKTTFKKQ